MVDSCRKVNNRYEITIHGWPKDNVLEWNEPLEENKAYDFYFVGNTKELEEVNRISRGILWE